MSLSPYIILCIYIYMLYIYIYKYGYIYIYALDTTIKVLVLVFKWLPQHFLNYMHDMPVVVVGVVTPFPAAPWRF